MNENDKAILKYNIITALINRRSDKYFADSLLEESKKLYKWILEKDDS